MKLLLDENLPKRLKLDFTNHNVFTVSDQGWNGIQNGRLLQLMMENGFHTLLTFDKNLQHQQKFQKYLMTVFLLSSANNTYQELTQLSPLVHQYLDQETLPVGVIVIQTKPTQE